MFLFGVYAQEISDSNQSLKLVRLLLSSERGYPGPIVTYSSLACWEDQLSLT